MNRTLQYLLALSLISLFLVSPVAAAATSQGLEWGVALNDEFLYHMVIVDTGVQTINEGVNLTVTETPPAIDDPLTNLTDIGTFDFNMTFYNGTSIGLYGLVFLGIFLVGSHFAYPIGNFSLLTELAMDQSWYNSSYSITDNSLYWGLVFSASSGDEQEIVTAEYLKSDGLFSRYIIQVTNTTDSTTSSYSFIRDNLPTLTTTTASGFDIVGFVTDNALYIGLGVIIILLVVIIVKKK
jgi:hypothetical protein